MERDLAHEADMAALRREQLAADCCDEPCDLDYDDYDPEQFDFEENWEE